MGSITVAAFLFDDDNEPKFWHHGLAPEQVWQVLEHRFYVTRNRKARRASHLIIGQDHQGKCIAIPIEPTVDPIIWRPVTAWPCKPSEAQWLPT